MSPNSAVILLRAPSDSEDKYEAAFSAIRYTPYSIPVLETALVNTEDLKRTIQSDSPEYDGVIVTSARACEAWKEAVDNLEGVSLNGMSRPMAGRGPHEESSSGSWQTKPFYVVGKGTGSALSGIHARHPDSPLVPNPSLIRGEDCGNADQLGRFIVEDLKSRPVKLLYLTGDKNRDTLPNILCDGDVDFHALQVYGTQGSSSFPKDLKATLDNASESGSDTIRWWIVFFAPSAAQFVLPYLQEHFDLPANIDYQGSPKLPAQAACIGPTTGTYLRETLGLHFAAMAAKPTPEDLVRAITSVDSAGNT
ncbi:uroporphyrinogen-III synthase [Marasmius crinis-equi]|uniref:Uroporphyrinogen-III synthase n=1 Tax=Marasmius crinis-equi TaxID=585013 RepID=A0ABR3FV68_9AGAR